MLSLFLVCSVHKMKQFLLFDQATNRWRLDLSMEQLQPKWRNDTSEFNPSKSVQDKSGYMPIYFLLLFQNLLLNTFSRSFVINFGLLQWTVIELRLCCWGLSSSKRLWVASEIWIFMGSEVDSIIYAIFSYGNLVVDLIEIGMIMIYLYLISRSDPHIKKG